MANAFGPPVAPPVRRILVVEDEYIIAAMVADMLADLGCRCIGPIATLDEGIEAAKTVMCDAAIINLVIQGSYAYEIAAVLAERNIPFCFASGVPQTEIDEAWRSRPFIAKPYVIEEIRDFLFALSHQP